MIAAQDIGLPYIQYGALGILGFVVFMLLRLVQRVASGKLDEILEAIRAETLAVYALRDYLAEWRASQRERDAFIDGAAQRIRAMDQDREEKRMERRRDSDKEGT